MTPHPSHRVAFPTAGGTPSTGLGTKEAMDLLRFAAVGSLDDVKSTLVGRLHFDTRQPFDDQVAAVVIASARRDIGVAVLAVGSPLAVDPYRSDRIPGSFVLVDEATNATVAAGMVGPPQLADPAAAPVGGA